MSLFAHLSQHNVNEQTTTDFQLPHLKGRPVLKLAPMTKENSSFLVDALKRPMRQAPRAATGPELEAAATSARLRDSALMARYVLKGWTGMLHPETGEEIPFNPQNARDFLDTLASKVGWMFDEIRDFATEITNFVNVIDHTETAKNSVGG
jgi:hypothetical protein